MGAAKTHPPPKKNSGPIFGASMRPATRSGRRVTIFPAVVSAPDETFFPYPFPGGAGGGEPAEARGGEGRRGLTHSAGPLYRDRLFDVLATSAMIPIDPGRPHPASNRLTSRSSRDRRNASRASPAAARGSRKSPPPRASGSSAGPGAVKLRSPAFTYRLWAKGCLPQGARIPNALEKRRDRRSVQRHQTPRGPPHQNRHNTHNAPRPAHRGADTDQRSGV